MSCRFSSDTSNQQQEKKNTYDIVINGGGVVGAAFAASVLQKNKGAFRVAIIEQGPCQSKRNVPTENDKPHLRVYAMSPKSTKFLDSFGAWKYIKSRSAPYNNMQGLVLYVYLF